MSSNVYQQHMLYIEVGTCNLKTMKLKFLDCALIGVCEETGSKLILERNYFTFNCGTRFKIHEDMSCYLKNVIYVMKCRGCGEEYIGKTGNFLYKRFTVHNQHLRDPKTRMLKVNEHIDNCANLLEPKYNSFPFYKMYTDSVTLRQSKEKLFINSLQPKLNRAI